MRSFDVTVNGVTYNVGVQESGLAVSVASAVTTSPVLYTAPAPVTAPAAAPITAAAPAPAPKAAPAPTSTGGRTLSSPMPGKIVAVNIKTGDCVKKGEVLFILEAMKMKNEIVCPQNATVVDCCVTVNQSVSSGAPLVVLG